MRRCQGQRVVAFSGCLGVQLVLIMQPDDGWAFCSEPVALHGWYMGGIASFWLNMFKNTELVRGPWCSVARVIGQAFLQSGHLWLWRRVSAVYGRMAGSVFFSLRVSFFLRHVGWMQFGGTPGSVAILLAREQYIMPGLCRDFGF